MRKIFIVVGAAFLVLTGAAVVLLFTPPVHKAVFLWAVKDKVDAVSVESVQFNGKEFTVKQLDLAHQGLQLTAGEAVVKASWFTIARSGEVHIEEIDVRDLRADLATMLTASGGGLGAWLDVSAADSDESFEGVLAAMRPVSHFSLGKLRLDGRVLLPENQSVDVNLTVDGLARGEKARIRLQGAFVDAGRTAAVDRATYDFGLEMDQSDSGQMQSLSGTLSLIMMGERLNPAGQLDLSGNWSLVQTTGGEQLTLFLAEAGNPDPLIDGWVEIHPRTGGLQGQLAASLKGTLLPLEWLELPAAVGTASLSARGQIGWNYKTGAGEFDLKGAGDLEQRPLEYELAGRGTAGQLPAVTGYVRTGFADQAGPGTLKANFDFNSGGDGEVRVPVTVQRGDRLSALTVLSDMESRTMNPFRVVINGERVYLADLQAAGKALAAWGYGMKKLDTAVEGGGAVAGSGGVPWEGITGTATVGIRQLITPRGHTLSQVNAEATISADAVTLTSFRSTIDSGELAARGALNYAANEPEPFRVSAQGAVRNLPSDLLDLGSGSPITGTWNGDLTLVGQDRSLENLAETVWLSLDVKGSSGVMEFSKINENAGRASKAMRLGALLGQFIQDERLMAISQMTEYLQRVPYDSIHIKVDRLAGGQVAIHDFTIRGPELLLSGSGTVAAQSWADLARASLDMRLSLGSKGGFGRNAAALGLIGQQKTGDYQLWRQPIQISGTLGNPNYSELKNLIFNALR